MESRENFSAISTMSPGSNGVRSFTSPGGSGLNGKRTPVTKKLIIKNLKVHNFLCSYDKSRSRLQTRDEYPYTTYLIIEFVSL